METLLGLFMICAMGGPTIIVGALLLFGIPAGEVSHGTPDEPFESPYQPMKILHDRAEAAHAEHPIAA